MQVTKRGWLAIALMALVLVFACGPRDTPQFSERETIGLVKTWWLLHPEDCFIGRGITSGYYEIDGWRATYEGDGVWLVAYTNYGWGIILSEAKWRVYEATVTVEAVDVDRLNCR